MRSQASLFTSGAFLATAVALTSATAVSAQTSPVADQSDPNENAAAESDLSASDIVITAAQRRDERLQDVPIAVTQVSGESLASSGITSTQDLAQVVSGLTMTQSAGFVQPFIRGVGSTSTAAAEQGSAALYIDGVYMPVTNGGAYYNLANIASIEVLKGPQGTLFGRNANAGAILINTRPPSFTPEGRVSLGYGNYNFVEASGFISGPFTDNVAGSIAASYDRHDGYYRNINTGQDVGTVENFSARGSVLIEATSNLNITLTGYYLHLSNPSTILSQPSNGYVGFMPGDLYPSDPRDYLSSETGVGNINEQWGASARVVYEGSNVDITSITAYGHFYTHSINYDSDTLPAQFVTIDQTAFGRNFTQELILSSNGSGALSWLVGAFYFNQKDRLDPALVTIGGNPRIDYTNGTNEAFAVFANATYDFGDIELTGGLRYSDESRTLVGFRVPGPFGAATVDTSGSWGSWTPRVVLAYHPNDDLLAYVSYARGFKSGNTNASSLSPDLVDPETVDAYEIGLKLTPSRFITFNSSAFFYQTKDLQVQALNPVTNQVSPQNAASVESYGVDVDLTVRPVRNWDVRLGVSYLHTEFTDFPNAQVYVPVPTGIPGFNNGNVSTIVDVTGNENVRSPKWTVSLGSNYTHELDNGGSIVASVNIYYSDSFYWEVGNRLREDPATVLNAQLTWNLPGDNVSVSLWGRNLGDQLRFDWVSPATQTDRRLANAPRTFGVRLGYRF